MTERHSLGGGNAGEPESESAKDIRSSNPPSLAQMSSSFPATTLDLSFASISWIPREQFISYGGVEELYLQGNKISFLPAELFRCLRRVRIARLEYNCLSRLPPEIGEWKAVETLQLHNNKIRWLPPQMGDLPLLRHLTLHSNELIRLPEELFQLHLTLLTLQDNPLSECVVRLFSFTFSHRRTLDLSRTDFKEECPVLGHLRMLKRLYLQENSLTKIPAQVPHISRVMPNSN